MNSFDISIKELELIIDKISMMQCENNQKISMYKEEDKLFVAIDYTRGNVKGSFIFLVGDE
jgi:hypothetical protein